MKRFPLKKNLIATIFLFILFLFFPFFSLKAAYEERIIFEADEEGKRQLYSMKPDGSDRKLLVPAGGSSVAAGILSSDGRKVYFFKKEDNTFDLWMAYTDGSGAKKLYDTNIGDGYFILSLSPDDQYLVVSINNPKDLYILDVKDPNRPQLVRKLISLNFAQTENVFWAKDNRIYFADDRDGGRFIFSIKPDGSDLRKETTTSNRVGMPRLCKNYLFVSYSFGDGPWRLGRYERVNNQWTNFVVLSNDYHFFTKKCSPDETKIAFGVDRLSSNEPTRIYTYISDLNFSQNSLKKFDNIFFTDWGKVWVDHCKNVDNCGKDESVVYLNNTKLLTNILNKSADQVNTQQGVSIPEAGTYIFEVKAKVYAPTLKFSIMCLKQNGCAGGKRQFDSYTSILADEISDWKVYKTEVELPKDDVSVVLFAYYTGEGEIDWVKLYKKGTTTNLLSNADFDLTRDFYLNVPIPQGWGTATNNWSAIYFIVANNKLYLNSSSRTIFSTSAGQDGKIYYTNDYLVTRMERGFNSGNYNQIRVRVLGARSYYKNWGAAKRGLKVDIICDYVNGCPNNQNVYQTAEIEEEEKEYRLIAQVPTNADLIVRVTPNDGTEGYIDEIRIEGSSNNGQSWTTIHFETFSNLTNISYKVQLPVNWWTGTNDWEARYIRTGPKIYCNKTPPAGQNLDTVHCGFYGNDSTPTNTPTPTPTSTPTPNPTCRCVNGNCTSQCDFSKCSNSSYSTPIKCTLSSSLFSSPPQSQHQDSWCQRPMRTQGDANGDNKVDKEDYFYYVQAVNGGKIPPSINPDANGDGEVGVADREIIVKKLLNPNSPLCLPSIPPISVTQPPPISLSPVPSHIPLTIIPTITIPPTIAITPIVIPTICMGNICF